MILATLCYVQHENKTLMLLRNKKPDDIHRGKYNGLGGKLEKGESPYECAKREIMEEAAIAVSELKLIGVLTFPCFDDTNDWYVFVYLAKSTTFLCGECDEGTLAWIENDKILQLPLWDGDKIFLPLVLSGTPFEGKFNYFQKQLLSYDLKILA